MQIKKFYAVNLPSAMRDVRKALGADAVILSTRNLSTADEPIMINGMRATVEVTAAQETPESVSSRPVAPKRRTTEKVPTNPAPSKQAPPARETPAAAARKPSQKPAAQSRPVEDRPLHRLFPAEKSGKSQTSLSSSKSRQAAQKRAKSLREKVFGSNARAYLEAYVDQEQSQNRRPMIVGAGVEKGEAQAGAKTPRSLHEQRNQRQDHSLSNLEKLRRMREQRLESGNVPAKDSPEAMPPPWETEKTRARLAARKDGKPRMKLHSRKNNPGNGTIERASHAKQKTDAHEQESPANENKAKSMQSILKELRMLSEEIMSKEAKAASPGAESRPSKGVSAKAPKKVTPQVEKFDKKNAWASFASEKTKEIPEVAREDWEDLNRSQPLHAKAVIRVMREQGVDEALSQRIVNSMFFSASRVDTRPWSKAAPWRGEEAARLREAQAGSFGQLVDVVKGYVSPPGKIRKHPYGPSKIALIGPTGVGKTTTIAKIASYYSLQEDLRVALVTLDTYRVAASDQLKTYARLLGVPMEIVTSENSLEDAFRRFESMDMILIDTPGNSPADRQAIQRLTSRLSEHSDVDIHLVVPSNLREDEMRRIMDSFRPVCYQRVIFSKLDEAGSWGSLLNSWIMNGLDVSYFTTGQRVPEDLESATVESICRSIMGDALNNSETPVHVGK